MKNKTYNKKILYTGLFLIWLITVLNGSYAQPVQHKTKPGLDKICRMHDAGSFLFFKQELKINPNNIFETYKSNFGLQKEDEMNLYRTQQHSTAGVTIYRYQQYHNGIKVHGAVMNVFEKNGIAEKANGRLIRNMESTDPQLSSSDALQIALQNIDPEEYQWTDPVWVSRFAKEEKLAGKKLEPEPELEYMYRKKSQRNAFDSSAYELCWSIKPNLKRGASKHVFISAANGMLVNELPLTLNCWTDAEFALPFNGAQKVLCSYVGNDCTPYGNLDQFICDDYADVVIETEDYDNSSPICFDRSFYTPKQVTGITADGAQVQWGLQKSLDFYWSKFNWRSYDNDYGSLDGYVNVSITDGNGNNALYDEFWEDFLFGYGNNKDNAFDSYTCIDIVGHEYTHGVDDYTADLDYSDESGALDESFADIMGEIIQVSSVQFPFYYDAIHFDWLVAADKSTGSIRSMSNPNTQGSPDTYLGYLWCDYNNDDLPCTENDKGGVHTNSGVQNFMFYLLVAGGSGVNDNGTSYNVTPVHIYDAQEIAFLSHTYLWGSAAYSDARDAWIQAAIDLFGNCSQQAISVAQAWRAVGVGLDEYGYDQNLCTYIPVGTYSAINNITTNGAGCSLNAIPVFGNIYFVAGNQIIFSPGTILTAFGGNMVDAFINPCNLTIYEREGNESLPSSGETTEERKEVNLISIYPNPATDRITVKISDTEFHTTLKIYTTSMQLISKFNLESGTENEIATDDLPAGVYFIESTVGSRSTIVKLVISR
jgi:Zn-dependent metalloprotease